MIVRKVFLLFASVFASAALFAAGRSDYLDLIEAAVDAYTSERRAAYIERVERDGITEHGFARLTSNIGILVANGRRGELRGEFVHMMDICAREQPIAEKRNGAMRDGHHGVGSEFAVKELVFAIDEAVRSGLFPKEKTDAWRSAFTPMIAHEIYSKKPRPGDEKANNWTIFGAASEQARLAFGVGGDPGWVERFVADQLRFFDANGMFRDPGCPMMYDFVTRLQYAVILSLGYAGPSRERLEAIMDVSAEPTIWMQSVTGEMPFGGRSNQFLHNETVYAALCEWYASHYAKRGKVELASRFRAAADRAVQSVRRDLADRPVHHVKNRYPSDSRYGCEEYAYFDKYMITMGSWAYLAFRFADESIPVSAAVEPDSVFVTGPDFHRVMMNADGWTLEFDLDGQIGYDATGLGRIQKRGAPTTLALAVPFPVEPHYRLDVTNACPLAIGPRGVARLEVKRAVPGEAVLRYPGGTWRTKVADDGIDMVVEQPGEIAFALPAFEFDGETHPRIDCGGKVLTVSYRGWTCRYETDGALADTGEIFGNRNGHYRLFEARAKDRLRVHVTITKDGFLVMDSNMNRFDPNPSKFASPSFQKECGFNAVAIQPGMPLAVTALFDGYDRRVFPEGSEARAWVIEARKNFAAKFREAKAAGVKVLATTDIIVLPHRMKELYHDEICSRNGRIDFMKPKTQEIYRALIAEFFETFPELDGIVVRTGETYTFNIPHHGGNGPCDYRGAFAASKDVHVALMNLLRDEVCVKRGKTCIYRTWDFGFFHTRPDYYLDVTRRVAPHERLLLSVKHCAGDFFRGVDFNRTLGLGHHRQIVEVQCQREYEGKGAMPSYVAASVIDGFEEHKGKPRGLRELAKNPLFAGVWTWSRGGGWKGPYVKNELWCELNARVMAAWANDPTRTEKECFAAAAEALGVCPESIEAFHQLALLTPKAFLRGKSATNPDARKGLFVVNMRDEYLCGLDSLQRDDWFRSRIRDGLMDGILADRREAVAVWEEIARLAAKVKCRDKATEDYILTSSLYGLRLFRMIEAGWDVMATGLKGDMSGRKYDARRLKSAIERYDVAKADYLNLPDERPDCATLFTDDYVRITVKDGVVEITSIPGLGESVDRYRKVLMLK